MKKIFTIATSLLIAFTLTACGSNSSSTQKKSNKNNEPKTTTSFENKNGRSILTTKNGTAQIYRMYGGASYDTDNKIQGPMIALSYKITNKTNKPLTADKILDGKQLMLYQNKDGKEKSMDMQIGPESAYPDTSNNNIDKINKLNDASGEWDSTKIEPNKTVIILDPTAFPVMDKDSKKYDFRVEPQEADGDTSSIDKRKNTIKFDDLEPEKEAKTAIELIK